MLVAGAPANLDHDLLGRQPLRRQVQFGYGIADQGIAALLDPPLAASTIRPTADQRGYCTATLTAFSEQAVNLTLGHAQDDCGCAGLLTGTGRQRRQWPKHRRTPLCLLTSTPIASDRQRSPTVTNVGPAQQAVIRLPLTLASETDT